MAVWARLFARSRGVPGRAPPTTRAPAGTTTTAESARAGKATSRMSPATAKRPPKMASDGTNDERRRARSHAWAVAAAR